MDARILMTESDWQLLDYAHRDLGKHGYAVVTAHPEEAMVAHSRWQPDVVVTSAEDLAELQRKHPQALEQLMARSVVLVTVSLACSEADWRDWARQGCEILFKPILHATELRAAMDFAVRVHRENFPREEGHGDDPKFGGQFRAG